MLPVYPFSWIRNASFALNLTCFVNFLQNHSKVVHSLNLFFSTFTFMSDLWYYFFLISLSGDIEKTQGPRHELIQNLSFSHWNLNSIPSHDFGKITSFIAFNSIHNYDILCFSETFLNSEISSDENSQEIPGYTLVRKDHPSDTKRGGVCLYFKTCLPVKIVDFCFLTECINFEITIENKLCNFIFLYRSPSQTSDQFQDFMKNFELNLETVINKNPFMLTVLGDFNAKSSNWYRDDITTLEGNEIDYATSLFDQKQLINELTHILGNSSSCIDLVFSSQSNLVKESGVLPSLHPNCHHQVIFVRFNLVIHYPPPYEREVWHYNLADTELINQAINNFNWDIALATDDVNLQVSTFNETILNIIRNHIPHEVIVCDDKDPPWVNKHIKKLMHNTEMIFKNLLRSKDNIPL